MPVYHDDHDEEESTIMTEMIRVIAPLTLKEGYTFDVLVDGEPYTVSVPKGGVKEGQEFQVPYERERHDLGQEESYFAPPPSGYNTKSPEEKVGDSQTLPANSGSEDDGDEMKFDQFGVPMGKWRTTLGSCCDVVMQSTFWMGCFCTPVMIAQLLTRMKLTWKGEEGVPAETSLTYNRILLSFLFVLAFSQIPGLGLVLVPLYYLIVVVYIGSNLRRYIRGRYRIRSYLPTKLGDKMDDACCMFWCCCCSAMQMARHTHDDKEYPGYGCTTTGIDIEAPHVV